MVIVIITKVRGEAGPSTFFTGVCGTVNISLVAVCQ